jgi:hypothetical protein
MTQKWALAAGGMVRVAVVTRAEMIDPQFDTMVAANRGLILRAFTSSAEAGAWLDALE